MTETQTKVKMSPEPIKLHSSRVHRRPARVQPFSSMARANFRVVGGSVINSIRFVSIDQFIIGFIMQIID